MTPRSQRLTVFSSRPRLPLLGFWNPASRLWTAATTSLSRHPRSCRASRSFRLGGALPDDLPTNVPYSPSLPAELTAVDDQRKWYWRFATQFSHRRGRRGDCVPGTIISSTASLAIPTLTETRSFRPAA